MPAATASRWLSLLVGLLLVAGAIVLITRVAARQADPLETLSTGLPLTALAAWFTPGVSGVIGVTLGLVAAHRAGWVDRVVTLALITGCLLCLLWIAAAGTVWVVEQLQHGAATGQGAPGAVRSGWFVSALLPLATVFFASAAAIALQVRAAARDVSGATHLLTLRSRGRHLTRVINQSAVRGVVPFILTILAIDAVAIFGGALVVQTVAGSLPRVLGLLLAYAVTVVLVSVAAGIPAVVVPAPPAPTERPVGLPSNTFRATDFLDVRELRLTRPAEHTDSRPGEDAGLSLTVSRGQSIALIGDEFSGVAELGRAIAGLSTATTAVLTGSILVDGRELVGLPEGQLRQLRGRQIGYLGPPSVDGLVPNVRVGRQIVSARAGAGRAARADAHHRAVALLERLRVPEAARTTALFPHELSPAIAHRVLLAGALACNPSLLVVEDPTSGLGDADAAAVLDLLYDLWAERGLTLIITAPGLGAARQADRVAVLHRGRTVEHASYDELLSSPRHPLSRRLLRAADTGR